jgi:ATP-dependent 26S proteasome regulatory subunit
MSSKIYVAERFRRAVVLHIVKNIMTQSSVRVPLILGIHGPSGYGKTYQCEQILSEMNVASFLISGGQLESGTAGEPARLIRENYINAGKTIEKGEAKAAVLLINDVDTGLGDWGDKVQTTINTQTVYGELMHLVDYPTSVEGRTTKRIPIILTGNDFTKLYAPLVRAGRMTSFEWNPTLREKADIIAGIFPELNIQECEKLVAEFSVQPIAFFSHLRSTLMDDILWNSIRDEGITKIVSYITNGREPSLCVPVNVYSLIAGRTHLN